jgi:hypothetical protein
LRHFLVRIDHLPRQAWDTHGKVEKGGVSAGMLEARTLHLVLVSKGFGVGMEPTAQPTKVISYKGAALTVRLDKV